MTFREGIHLRKLVPVLLALLMFTGCGAEPTMEMVADVWAEPALPEPGSIHVALPGETALPVIESDSGRIYLCNDYEVYLETMESGDLPETVRTMSGFSPEEVTMVSTSQDGMDRHEFVWASVGETGDWLGRGVVLDDGNYHYTMTVLRSAESVETSQVVWDGVFNSFRID